MLKNNKNGVIIICLLLLFILTGNSHASSDDKGYARAFEIGIKASKIAAAKLGKPSVRNYLVITNAGSVRVRQSDSLPVIDGISKAVRATVGKGSLLIINDKPDKPLFMFFYNTASRDAMYIEIRRDEEMNRFRSIFAKQIVWKDFLSLTKNDEAFENFSRDKTFGGNEHRLLMVAWLWEKGASMELKKAVQLHDHYCPGVTSGYFIGRYLLENFKLSEGESYTVLSSPIWCKDDALQVMLNATVGKKSMFALPVSDKEKGCLVEEAKDIAGIFFRYNRREQQGEAVVLGFNWEKLRADAGASSDTKSITNTIKLTDWMISNKGNYKNYVRKIKEIKLAKDEKPDDYANIGVNPFLKAGLWKQECTTTGR